MGSNLFDTGGSLPSYSSSFPLWSGSQNLYFTRFRPLLIGRALPPDWSVSRRFITFFRPNQPFRPFRPIYDSARHLLACFSITCYILSFSRFFLKAGFCMLLLHLLFLDYIFEKFQKWLSFRIYFNGYRIDFRWFQRLQNWFWCLHNWFKYVLPSFAFNEINQSALYLILSATELV